MTLIYFSDNHLIKKIAIRKPNPYVHITSLHALSLHSVYTDQALILVQSRMY